MRSSLILFILSLVFIFTFFISCKKNDPAPSSSNTTVCRPIQITNTSEKRTYIGKYSYNQDGNVVSALSTDENGVLNENLTRTFNYQIGKLISRYSPYKNGSEIYIDIAEYEYTDNYITKETHSTKRPDGSLVKSTSFTSYEYDGVGNLIYLYDYGISNDTIKLFGKKGYRNYINGRPQYKDYYTPRNNKFEVFLSDFYEYDNNFNKIRETKIEYNNDGSVSSQKIQNEFSFDANIKNIYIDVDTDNPNFNCKDRNTNFNTGYGYYDTDFCASGSSSPILVSSYTSSNLKANSNGCMESFDDNSTTKKDCTTTEEIKTTVVIQY